MRPAEPAPYRRGGQLLTVLLAAMVALAGALATQPAAGATTDTEGRSRYGEVTTRCTVTDQALPEISGAVQAGRRLLVANDKGAELFELDESCEVVGRIDLLSIRPKLVRDPDRLDVEDLAVGPDGTRWLVDSGGNRFSRETIQLLGVDRRGEKVRRLVFRYPSGTHDAEAAMVTLDSRLVLFTKRPGGTSIYSARIPASRPGRPLDLRWRGSLDLDELPGDHAGSDQLVTGASLSPDGLHVALRTYSAAYEWTVGSGDVVKRILARSPREMGALSQRQGEAIAYLAGGTAVAAFSEQLPAPVLEIDIEREAAAAVVAAPERPAWLLPLLAGLAGLLVLGLPWRRRSTRSLSRPATGVPRRSSWSRAGRFARTMRRVLRSGAARSGLVLTLVVVVAGAGLSSRVEERYESSAIVAFMPRDPVATGAETMVLVMPKYVEVLRSPPVVDLAAAQLAESPERVRDASSAMVEPNTLNLVVRTVSTDAQTASALAQVLAAGLIQAAAEDPLVRAELVAAAVPSSVTEPPTPGQVLVLSLLLGLLSGAVVAGSIARRSRSWTRLVGPGPTQEGDPAGALGRPTLATG